MKKLWQLLRKQAVIIELDDDGLPVLCRESMCFGQRLCELPHGHAGSHYCKAVREPKRQT